LRAFVCENITLVLAITYGGRNGPIIVIDYCVLEF